MTDFVLVYEKFANKKIPVTSACNTIIGRLIK